MVLQQISARPYLNSGDGGVSSFPSSLSKKIDRLWCETRRKYFVFNSRPQSVHVGVNDDEDKGNDKIEDQPDVDHLDVRSCRKALVHLWEEYKF